MHVMTEQSVVKHLARKKDKGSLPGVLGEKSVQFFVRIFVAIC